MIIHATFINRHHDPESPEIIHAWDEYCRDDNEDGYQASLAEAMNSLGSDLLNQVTVQLRVDYDQIAELLNPPAVTVNAEIVKAE